MPRALPPLGTPKQPMVGISVLVGGKPWLPQSISRKATCGSCGGLVGGAVSPRATTAVSDAVSGAKDLFMGIHALSNLMRAARSTLHVCRAANHEVLGPERHIS